jgi:4-carboxymuconolactone decarboxylase
MSEIAQERIQKGMAQFSQMVGETRAREIQIQWHRISPDFEEFVLGILAGEVWSRQALDLRTRSLVTIAGLTALGRTRGLALNIEMALHNGASREEIRETMLQMAFYAGFPAAWEGLQIAEEIFQQTTTESTGQKSDRKP